MTSIPQWIVFAGEAVPVGTAFGPLAVTGSGFVHVTSSNIDGAANLGTAGQFAVTNAGGTDTSWVALTQDVTNSTSTAGQLEVVGLLTHALPSLTTGFLNWTGSAWALSATGSTVTWANDLAGSTATDQYVAALTGPAGTPGAIPLNASSWISQTAGNIFLKTGTSTVLSVDGSSNTVLNAPSGSGVVIDNNGSTIGQLAAANADFVAFGASPPSLGYLRMTAAANTPLITANYTGGNSLPIIGFDPTGDLVFGITLPPVSTASGGNSFLRAQNGTGASSNGGSVALIAGSPGSGGAYGSASVAWGGPTSNLNVQFSGGANVSLLGNVLWSSALGPALLQATPPSNASVSNFNISAQSANASSTGTANISGGSVVLTAGSPATANGSSGNISLVLAPPSGTSTEGFVSITRGSNVEMCLGASPSDTAAAIWMGKSQTANANGTTYTLATTEAGAATVLNGPTGTSTVTIAVQGVASAFANSTFWGFNVPVGGDGAVPYQPASTTQGLTANSNNILSSPAFPIQRFSGAANGSTTRIILPFGYRTEYILDFTACTALGSNTFIVQANTATKAITVSAAGVFRMYTDGTNNVYSTTYS